MDYLWKKGVRVTFLGSSLQWRLSNFYSHCLLFDFLTLSKEYVIDCTQQSH